MLNEPLVALFNSEVSKKMRKSILNDCVLIPEYLTAAIDPFSLKFPKIKCPSQLREGLLYLSLFRVTITLTTF